MNSCSNRSPAGISSKACSVLSLQPPSQPLPPRHAISHRGYATCHLPHAASSHTPRVPRRIGASAWLQEPPLQTSTAPATNCLKKQKTTNRQTPEPGMGQQTPGDSNTGLPSACMRALRNPLCAEAGLLTSPSPSSCLPPSAGPLLGPRENMEGAGGAAGEAAGERRGSGGSSDQSGGEYHRTKSSNMQPGLAACTRVQGSGFQGPGSRVQDSGLKFGVQGSRFRG